MADASAEPNRRLRLAYWLAVPILLALAVWCGLLIHSASGHSTREADADEAQRVASRFLTNLYTVDYKTYDRHTQRLLGDLAPKAKDLVEKGAARQKAVLTQQKLTVRSSVWSAGVITLASTTAEVAVTVNVTRTADAAKQKEARSPQPGYVRAKVTLVKRDGRWLVSDMRPVS